MPRRPKDPNNPITKLRRQLSSTNQPLTRQMFAKRYGFSAETLKALETGRYKLSHGVAVKIAVAVGVDVDSLLKNQDPLLDWNGNPITPETKPALRELNLNANSRLDYLINAAFNAARKHPKGDRSPLFVLLFDYWLADTMAELDLIREFWAQLWGTGDYSELASGDMFPLGGDPEGSEASLEKIKARKYIERPEEVRISDYGFHELVAHGLARPAMLETEKSRLLLEYLTPAEIAEFDEPINWELVYGGGAGDPKYGAPERIAYRRFAESKRIDPDDQEAVSDAFFQEAWRRFQQKEEKWRRGEAD
jgi:DNA-binding XRE family transcriptional regulator